MLSYQFSPRNAWLVAALIAMILTGWRVAHSFGQQEVGFGPRLLLITSVDEKVPAPLPPTVVIHAQLNGTKATHFMASGSAEDVASLTANGIPVRELDADTAGKVYYFADATADNAQTLAASVSTVIYSDPLVLLLATTQANEKNLLETLVAQGVQLAALTADPLNLQMADTIIERQVDSAGDNGSNLAPDALIASLLPLLTESDLTARINELGGVTNVNIGGKTVNLGVRYTFSPRIRDAESYLTHYYAGLGMQVYDHDWAFGAYTGRNVIAEILGTLHPERIWLIGGHFDTISNNSYNRSPGADDNGTGIAATMLIAKILRNYHFADTIRFVHFSGEEQGQWGSKRYARDLALSGTQVMGYVNLDMIGWDGNGDRVVELHTGLGPRSNALGTAMIENNEQYSQGLVIERKSTTASRFSDHSPFWDNNYPALLAIENFFNDGIARDRNPWYHNVGDLPARVDVNYVARFGRLALATLAELAELQSDGPGTSTPTATQTPTPAPTLTATPLPGGCTNLLVNGDAEGSGGWQFGSTPFAAGVATTEQYAGERALRLGIPSGNANRLAHSSAFQKATIPATAQHVYLHYWQRPGGGSDLADYRETLFLRSNYSYWSTLERNKVAGADQWVERTFDVTGYRGSTLVVYFNVFNNGTASQQWNYLDNIGLLVCAGARLATQATPVLLPAASETPTLIPTAPATPTLVATAPASTPGTLYLPLVAH